MKVTGFSYLGIGADEFATAPAFFRDVMGIRVAIEDARGIAMLQVGGPLFAQRAADPGEVR